MAINFTVSYTFAPSTTISSSQVNTNTSDNAAVWQGLEAKTKSFAALQVDATPTAAADVVRKDYVDVYAGWRRPVLQFSSVTQVVVEANTGTANETKIVFPDGNARTVVEDTSSTHKYRKFDITAAAEFTSGTEDSGLRSGITEATNTWYAIYAVKSAINTANFVLAGDTTLPITANFSTLNTRYGSGGWLYLGMIRNGDQSGATGDILNFIQNGNQTVFKNSCANSATGTGNGLILAATVNGTSVTYSYSAGTSGQVIPNTVNIVKYLAAGAPVGNETMTITDSGTGYFYSQCIENAIVNFQQIWADAPSGLKISLQGATSDETIFLTGFVDGALGVGSNPLI